MMSFKMAGEISRNVATGMQKSLTDVFSFKVDWNSSTGVGFLSILAIRVSKDLTNERMRYYVPKVWLTWNQRKCHV